MKIPVMRMYEHNEAYYYWNKMIEAGYIEQTGNYLLHVDHHPDMEGGGYAWDFTHKPVGEEVKKFTYDVLGIADFIQPAIFYRIFSEVHILKNLMPVELKPQSELIQCTDGKCLIKRPMIPFIHAGKDVEEPEKYSFYTYYEGGLGNPESFQKIIQDKSVVLDVDLDYFCWDDSLSTRNPKRIEITKEAYEEYLADTYHFLKILPRRLMYAVEADGKYYLEYKEQILPNKRPTKEKILQRMDKLLDWFAKCNLQPAAIDVCSSHCSGYLPEEMYPWIEEVFLEKLWKLWELEIC